MRFALLTQFNWAYRYGFNGLINGLDYHGHENVDVHVIHSNDIPEDHIDKISSAFDFKVVAYNSNIYANRYPPPKKGNGSRWLVANRWQLEFYKYKLALELADDYDAILIMDCDYLILGNVTNYLKAVVNTDLIMTGNNVNAFNRNINEASVTDPEYHDFLEEDSLSTVPIMNHPFFFDPKRNTELLNYIYTLGQDFAQDIRPFNHALYALDRFADIVVLPATLWGNIPIASNVVAQITIGQKRCYRMGYEKIMMLHGYWWNLGSCMNTIHFLRESQPVKYELCKANIELLHAECNEINVNWKVSLPLS